MYVRNNILEINHSYTWGWNQHCGFVCAYQPDATGLSPKHAIYAIKFVINLSCEKNQNKQKDDGFVPFKKV